MDLILWLCDHPLTWAPQWVQQWRRRTLARVVERDVIPQMLTAQAAGVGIHDAWVEPGTPPGEILSWFDDRLAAAPRVPGFDLFRMVVATCAPHEWDAGGTLADDAVVALWQGSRTDWWRDGRDRLAAAITPEHPGLYVVANAIGTTLVPPRS